MLRARLARIEEEKREAERAQKYKDKARVGFVSNSEYFYISESKMLEQGTRAISTLYWMEIFRDFWRVFCVAHRAGPNTPFLRNLNFHD